MDIRDNEKDQQDLVRAVRLLTSPSVLIKISNALGSTIEAGVKKLPKKAQEGIQEATQKGLWKSLELAEKTLDSKVQDAWTTSHLLAAAASGAVGGFFGLPALLLEIPITTTVMMRSILDIARSEGHELTEHQIQLQCLGVFSYGSNASDKDDAADTGYYAGRAAMAEMISEASKSLGKIAAERSAKGISASTAGQWLAKLIDVIAARFGFVITEKAALQAAPVLGAFTGAAINSLFIDYYQDIARGHFIMLRLEKQYGTTVIQQEFEAIRSRSR